MLREGLDLPEVSLVASLDADKEGFLRSENSLIQTAGRAARNVNSKVIMYADKITGSMQRMIDETNRRRIKQLNYNALHNITPESITKSITPNISLKTHPHETTYKQYTPEEEINIVADSIVAYLKQNQLKALIKETEKRMKEAKELIYQSKNFTRRNNCT